LDRGPTISKGTKIWVVKERKKESKINLQVFRGETEQTVPLLPPQATVLASPAAAMAKFPVNPLAFLPEGMTIDHGPADRKVRTDLVISPNALLHNDKVVIAETNRFVPIHLRQSMRDDVRALLDEARYTVSAFDDHPFGLGSYTFMHTLSADTVIGLSFEIDEITSVTFVKHNEAKNMRLTTFGKSIWLLMLGFPLDY
jgi:hypothetical protein